MELRKCDDDKRTIAGYAAVFYREGVEGTEYRFAENYSERVHPEAFNEYLEAGGDVSALFDHSTDMLLGRRVNGTLRLSVDDVGLRYEIDLPDTTAGNDVAKLVERGDLRGSSFGFRRDPQSDKVSREGKLRIRELRKVDYLRDVGPVTHPAYDATSVFGRSEDDVAAEIDAQLAAADGAQLGADESSRDEGSDQEADAMRLADDPKAKRLAEIGLTLEGKRTIL